MCKVMGRMVLARISWVLENKDRNEFPASSLFQTGFKPGLSTMDSIAVIHEGVLFKQPSSKPNTVVAIDVKKAFDSVSHWAVIREAINRGLGGR